MNGEGAGVIRTMAKSIASNAPTSTRVLRLPAAHGGVGEGGAPGRARSRRARRAARPRARGEAAAGVAPSAVPATSANDRMRCSRWLAEMVTLTEDGGHLKNSEAKRVQKAMAAMPRGEMRAT